MRKALSDQRLSHPEENNAPTLWLLLSSDPTAPRQPQMTPKHSNLEVGKRLGGNIIRTADSVWIFQRDIPGHISAQQYKLGKRREVVGGVINY